MGYLTIYSESGFPHAGCFLQYDEGAQEWLCFEPTLGPYGDPGRVDESDHSAQILFYVTYYINDPILHRARDRAVSAFASATYNLFLCDCVSFACHLVRGCGLNISSFPHFVPNNLVIGIVRDNQNHVYFDDDPPPWGGRFSVL